MKVMKSIADVLIPDDRKRLGTNTAGGIHGERSQSEERLLCVNSLFKTTFDDRSHHIIIVASVETSGGPTSSSSSSFKHTNCDIYLCFGAAGDWMNLPVWLRPAPDSVAAEGRRSIASRSITV